jgi:hypothetical protein
MTREQPEKEIIITPENEGSDESLTLEGDIQIALMQRRFGKNINTENELNWIDDHSNEFRKIFHKKIAEDTHLWKRFKENPEPILNAFEKELYQEEEQLAA